jgi:hypothetical protein
MALSAGWAGTSAPAAPPAGALLPDLVADPPQRPGLEQYTSGGETRLILRFDGYIHNKGAGPVEFRGAARSGTTMTSVAQRFFNSDGSFTDVAAPVASIAYETEDGHDHWHLGEAARYSLWNSTKTAEVAPAAKVGFCLEDSERYPSDNGPTTPVYTDAAVDFCEDDEPTIANVWMGITPGWRDIYNRSLAFQWVDVSDTAPGSYWVRGEVDTNDVVEESNEVNAPAYAPAATTIPGYVATPLVRQGLVAGQAATLTLGSTQFGSPGARRFLVESAPEHGDLNVAVGDWFTSNSISYTPNAAYEGTDSFKFSAADSTSSFPRTPPQATVSLGVEKPPAETVAIGGATEKLDTGAGVQLTATVQNGPATVTWTATAGTISSTGFYTAPDSVPASGKATVRATGSSGAFDEAEIEIVKPPDPEPAPGPVDPPPDDDPPSGGDPPPTGGDPPPTGGDPPPTGGDPPPTGGDPPPTGGNPQPPTGGNPPPPTGGNPPPPTGNQPPPSGSGDPQPPVTTPPAFVPLLSAPRLGGHGHLFAIEAVPGRGGVVETKAMVGKRRVGLCRVKTPARRTNVCRMRVPRRFRLIHVLFVVKLRVGGEVVATRRAHATERPAHTH